MFQIIKLSSYKALPEKVLDNLGKINIVCGKNSSGKSTLLAAIGNRDTRRIGEKSSDELADYIVTNSPRAIGWSSAAYPGAVQEYSNVMLSVIRSRPVWYKGDEMSFAQEFFQAFRLNSLLNRNELSDGILVDTYRNRFNDDVNSVLVAPKRFVELRSTIRMDAEVLPHGYGLLPYLFFAKNQVPTSAAGELYTELSSVFTDITSGAQFSITPTTGGDLELFFTQGTQRTSAEDAGLGLQELLVILFFAVSPAYQCILLEEPESHLHPEWQRRLLSYLRNGTDKQYFLSTHSNIFLDAGLIDRVFFTSFNGEISVDDATNRSAVLNDLGYAVTDNLVSDLVLLVEGPKDAQVLEEFLIKMNVWGEYNIKIWPLGGDIMDQVDLSVFAERNNILALVDYDPGSAKVRRKFIANCNELGIPVTRLRRYAVENYLSVRAIRQVYQQNHWENAIPDALAELAPRIKVQTQTVTDIKRNIRMIAAEMTLEEIENVGDLYDFLKEVRQKCEDIRR